MTVFNSLQYAAQIAIPPVIDQAYNSYGKLRMQKINYTQLATGTDGDELNLIKLPPGRVSLIGGLSYLRFSAWTASTVIKVGWLAYKDPFGVDVAASLSGIIASQSIATAAQVMLSPITVDADGVILFESLGGVVLQAEITGAAPLAAAVLNGVFVYAVE